MTHWNKHIFNARAALTDILDTLSGTIAHAETACAKVHPPVSLDLTVRATEWPMPKELRVSGSAYGPGRIDLVIDISERFHPADLRQALLRAIFHEFHHVLRWDSCGYGRTLGEALVSEGLAQHFLHEMMQCPVEPWENAVDEETLRNAQLTALHSFDDAAYDHARWFFGTTDLPKWTGYSIGYAMVARHFSQNPGLTALTSTSTPASEFMHCLE